MDQPDKVLLLLGGTVGDSVCITGAIRILKQYNPELIIDLLAVRPDLKELFQYNNDIHHIFLSPDKDELIDISKQYEFALAFPVAKENFYFLRRMCLKTFFPAYGDKNIISAALDLFGYFFPKCNGHFPDRYYIEPQAHHFEEAKNILKQSGAILSDEEILIGCHVGYSSLAEGKKNWWKRIRNKYGSKAWPPKNYITLLEKLIAKNPNVRFVLTGTKAEIPIIRKFFNKYSKYCYNVAGKTSSLLTLAAIMKQLKCFISGDTGPMHIAVAMDIPLISLFSPRTLEIGKPYPPREYQKVLVKPNISEITVDEVYDELVKLIKHD